MSELAEAIEQVKRAKLLCKDCYLLQGGMAGQAITEWYCQQCGGKHMSGSTATNSLCRWCSMVSGLCEDCGVKKHIYQVGVKV